SIVSGPNWLQIDPATGTLTGTPGPADVGPVQIRIRVEEPANPVNFAEADFDFDVEPFRPGLYLREKFGSCAGWNLNASWQCGTPSNVGPESCRSAGGCMATNISGFYVDNLEFASTTADSPTIDLTTAVEPQLSFFAWVKTEGPSWDAFNVKIRSDGGPWVLPAASDVSPSYTSSGPGENSWGGDLSVFGWRRYTIDVSAYVGHVIQLRFAFRSDGSNTEAGVYIDDLIVSEPWGDPVAILTERLPSAFPGAPWNAALIKEGGSAAAQWSLVSGPAWMQIDPQSGVLSGTPPAAGDETITVHVMEPASPVNSDTKSLDLQIVVPPTAPYLDSDFTAWTVAGEWEVGQATSGPGSCRTTADCLATRLGGNYNSNASYSGSTATSPTIDLTAAVDPMLFFWAWVETEEGYDGFNLRISVDGGPFELFSGTVPAYSGTAGSQASWYGSMGWTRFAADLSPFVGHEIALRLSFRSDGGTEYAGVYVDELRVVTPGLDPLAITTSALPDVFEGMPYVAKMAKAGGTSFSTWSIVAGPAWLQIDPLTGRLSGSPDATDVGPVTARIRVEEVAFPSNSAEADFAFEVEAARPGVFMNEKFTSCAAWSLSGEWECGTPTSGPGSCRSAGGCMATNLTGNYSDNIPWGAWTAISPELDLSNAVDPRIAFWAWVRTESAGTDAFNVKISRDGGRWELPAASQVSPAYLGTAGGESGWGGNLTSFGWRRYVIDARAYAGSSIRVMFDFRTDTSSVYPGVYVDDLMVVDSFADPLE
ncbi:MAG TPA: hypothetical protein VGD74_09800, partial [Vulgatibacter sp.]